MRLYETQVELFDAVVRRLDDTKGIEPDMMHHIVPDLADIFWDYDCFDLDDSAYLNKYFTCNEDGEFIPMPEG